MGCCSKTITRYRHIAAGYGALVLEFFGFERKNYHLSLERLRICRTCEKITWWSRADYFKLLLSYGIKVFTDLSKLPELEIRKKKKGTYNFCAICKCYLPAKTSVKNECCPIEKWQSIKGFIWALISLFYRLIKAGLSRKILKK